MLSCSHALSLSRHPSCRVETPLPLLVLGLTYLAAGDAFSTSLYRIGSFWQAPLPNEPHAGRNSIVKTAVERRLTTAL